MNRNVEVKVRVDDLSGLARRLIERGAEDRGILVQKDTYFHVPSEGGMRLKVREQDPGGTELISYGRPNVSGLRTSNYQVCKLPPSPDLAAAIALSLGVISEVRKRRHLFMLGRTRVHLDDVEKLGSFLELEVVLKEGESESDGETEAEKILGDLGLAGAERIAGSYSDMQ